MRMPIIYLPLYCHISVQCPLWCVPGAGYQCYVVIGHDTCHHLLKLPRPLSPAASRGARLDTRDRDTCLPLHVAAVRGHVDTIAYLVARGQHVDSVDGAGRTPLMLGEIINSSLENDSHKKQSLCTKNL